MKITIAQLNPIVGDVYGNTELVKKTLEEHACRSDLIIFSELFLVGYPPRDLLEKKWLIDQTEEAWNSLLSFSNQYPSTGILIGLPVRTGKNTGTGLYNAAGLIYKGSCLLMQHKSLLPTYDVFDEARYFDPAPDVDIVVFKNRKLGISICEDAWNDPELWAERVYVRDPVDELVRKGADILINVAASPFHTGKEQLRLKIAEYHAKKHGKPFIFVNQIGGNDELIFDGGSFCVDKNGIPTSVLPRFETSIVSISCSESRIIPEIPDDPIREMYHALVLGIRDYVRKCGFKKAVVGLSGGIDSALTCCLAAAALGPENVLGILMPGPYSSKGSIEDALELVKNIGIKHCLVPIRRIMESYRQTLFPQLGEIREDVTEENIQARIRGNILMAFSNKFGYLVLSTGNKSELAVGYCTLYGDMSGGLSVLADVYKTQVFKLAFFINREKQIIPVSIIEKPPSAELKPDQKDEDTLPPYELLDQIIRLYLDEKKTLDEIISMGYKVDVVRWVVKRINLNEYKRKQAPPGLKVTTKAFGMGRRIPIAAKFEV